MRHSRSDGPPGQARQARGGPGLVSRHAQRAQERLKAENINNMELREHDFRNLPPLKDISLVVSNYAIHHLTMDEKRTLFSQVADLLPEKGVFVMGDVMWSLPLDQIDEPEQFYNPDIDLPSPVDEMVEALESCGFLCEALRLSPGVGVIEAWKQPQQG